jgi:hypothetical protein
LHPFDFYKTQPAPSDRREIRVVTEMGNIDPCLQCGFKHCPPLFRLNVPSVDIQCDHGSNNLLCGFITGHKRDGLVKSSHTGENRCPAFSSFAEMTGFRLEFTSVLDTGPE